MGDLSSLANVNPLQAMLNIATTSKSGYQRGLRWISLFALSGVDIPITIWIQFATLASKFRVDLRDCSLLVNAALYSSWLRPTGRLELQTMISMLHAHLSAEIINGLQASENLENM